MIGRHDLPVIWHQMRFPNFERYWVIEDDVRYSGDWRGGYWGSMNPRQTCS